MRLAELIEAAGWEAVVVPDPDVEIAGGYTSDLLSDVMAHCPEDALLITVQNHNNSVAVCTLVGAPAILLVHGRDVPDEMRATAEREQVAILRTSESQFAASCRVGKFFE